jgi:hypothetical protein
MTSSDIGSIDALVTVSLLSKGATMPPGRGADMRRREFLSLVSGAIALPAAARARQAAMPLVGFLSSQELAGREHLVAAFRRGLGEAGYIEGQNVAVEYHSAENQPDQSWWPI